MLIRYPPLSKGQWKNLVLASVNSNQQTLVLKKKDFSRICENQILVESVQMILSLQSGTFFKVEIIHTWKLYISKLIAEN